MSANNKGKSCYTNGVKNIYLSSDDKIPEGFYKGFSYKSKETLQARVNKTKQTKLNKYGDENYNNSNKNKATCLIKYGVDNPAKLKEVQDKMKETSLERYGVEHASQSPIVKDRIKQTLLERYGVENISQTETHREQVSVFWNNISDEKLSEIMDKRRKTCYDKYGVDNGSKLKSTIDKIEGTCLERYGVNFFCMSEDCRKASSNNSTPNKEFEKILTESGVEFIREFNIERKSYDFLIPTIKTLIEINPYSTHNSTWSIFGKEPITKTYHKDKMDLAVSNGFRCINVWDWDNTDKILNLINARETLYARNCDLCEISPKDCSDFINTYHLQGNVKSTIQIALKYDGEIVSVMTFGKPRYNTKFDYELLRYCSSKNIVGGAERIYKYFIDKYNPQSVISYCDLSKFSGTVYEKIGFSNKSTKISKHWYNAKTKTHITDNLLRQRGFDQLLGSVYGYFGKGTDNEELMKQHGFVEIFDCGQSTYVWFNKSIKIKDEDIV